MPIDHNYLQYNKVYSNKHQQFHISKISGNPDVIIDTSNLLINTNNVDISGTLNNMLVFDFANKRINPASPNNNGLINLGYKTTSDRARFNEVHLKELFTTQINNYWRYRLYSDPTYSSDPFIIYSDQNGTTKFFSIDISGISTFGNNLIVNGDVSATTFYGDGSNLTGISSGGGGGASLTDYSDASFGNVEISGNFIVNGSVEVNSNMNVNGDIVISGSAQGSFSGGFTGHLAPGQNFYITSIPSGGTRNTGNNGWSMRPFCAIRNGGSTWVWGVSDHGTTFSKGQMIQHMGFTYSDDRLKHNEININNGLDIIRQLEPQKYQKTDLLLDANYTGDLSDYDWHYESGLIAQDLLKINDLSFVVSQGDYYDENDNLIERPYVVSYDGIFTYNIAATKELDVIVQSQQTEINNLKTENTLLKSKLNEILSEMGKETI